MKIPPEIELRRQRPGVFFIYLRGRLLGGIAAETRVYLLSSGGPRRLPERKGKPHRWYPRNARRTSRQTSASAWLPIAQDPAADRSIPRQPSKAAAVWAVLRSMAAADERRTFESPYTLFGSPRYGDHSGCAACLLRRLGALEARDSRLRIGSPARKYAVLASRR